MTSCGGKSITESRIPAENWDAYLPVFPSPSHPPFGAEPLRLEKNARMRKNSYVNTLRNYRVPLVLLKRFDDKKKIASHRLTPQSLEILRTACGLGLHRPISHDPPLVPRACDFTPHIPLPTSSRLQNSPPAYETHAGYEAQEHHIQHQLYGASARLPGLYVDPERQPLWPHSASSSPARRFNLGIPSRSPWETESGYRGADHSHIDAPSSSSRVCWNLLKAVVIYLSLCTALCLLALLGYGLFLGVMWLVHGLVAVVVVAKEDIAAFGRAVARPVMAVGRGIGAGARAVAGFVGRIVQWVRGVMG